MTSLRNLKKTTVKEVIRLANRCPEEESFTREEIRAGLQGQFSSSSPSREFNAFLHDLTAGELAELTALCWLGRDMLPASEWDDIIARAGSVGLRDLQEASKRKLPQYLRSGMERLARVAANKVRPSHVEEDARKQIIADFVLQSFKKNYGDEHGLHRLISLMETSGCLDDPDKRALFGLPPERVDDPLEEVLRNSGKPAAIKVGEIRNS